MSVTYGGRPCLDPLVEAQSAASLGYPTGPWYGRANSFVCPEGPIAGQGWLLMLLGQLRTLATESLHDLTFAAAGNTVTLRNLLYVRALAAEGAGRRADDTTAMWVEVRDRRYLYQALPIDRAYNVPSAPGSVVYWSATRNAGFDWTWSAMLGDLWAQVGTARLGAYPGLPFAPDGAPESFDFYAANAWSALNGALERISCALKYDPIADAFSIIRIGAADAAAAAALTNRDGQRVWDAYPLESARGRVPQKVRVHFVRSTPVADTTGGSPYYTLDCTDTTAGGALAGVEVGSYALLYDDLTAKYDSTGALTNAGSLSNRADERAADFFRRARQTRLERWYTGGLADAGLRPGAQLKQTSWHDAGDGLVTRVARFPGLGPDDGATLTGGLYSEVNVFSGSLTPPGSGPGVIGVLGGAGAAGAGGLPGAGGATGGAGAIGGSGAPGGSGTWWGWLWGGSGGGGGPGGGPGLGWWNWPAWNFTSYLSNLVLAAVQQLFAGGALVVMLALEICGYWYLCWEATRSLTGTLDPLSGGVITRPVVPISPAAGTIIKGIPAPVPAGPLAFFMLNVGTNPAKVQDTAATTAAERVKTPGAVDTMVQPGAGVKFAYDVVNSWWRMEAGTPATTKGDLLLFDGIKHLRRAVGTDGQVLTADSAQSDGVRWAAAAAGTIQNGQAALAAPYTLTAAIANIGLSVTLPDNGTYELCLSIQGNLQTNLDGDYVEVRLRDTTGAATVAGSTFDFCTVKANVLTHASTGVVAQVATGGVNHVIDAQAKYVATGALTTNNIPVATLTYKKLA